MADAMLLRSLGVAAAPTALLAALDQPCLERLLRLLGGMTGENVPPCYSRLPFDEEADRELEARTANNRALFQLVLLAGSVAAVRAETPESLVGAARHLLGAGQHLRFDWKGLSVWYPTAQDLAGLGYCRDLRSVEALRRFVWTPRTPQGLTDLAQGRLPVVRVPTAAAAYFELWKKRQTVPQRATDFQAAMQKYEEAQRKYESFVEAKFVSPLIEKSLKSGDPVERVLLVAIASFSRLFHQVLPDANAARSQSINECQGQDGRLFPPETFRQIIDLGDILLKSITQHKNLQDKGRRR